MCEQPSNPTSNLSPAALYAPPIALAQSLLTARESHDPHLIRTCLLAQGWQSTSMVSSPYLEQAELLLCATGAPAVRSWSAGAGPLQTLAGWCSRALGSGATSSSPLTMIKGSLRISVWWTFSSFAALHLGGTFDRSRARRLSLCVCVCFLSAAEMVGVGVG
jgi:hypothetical protein